MLCSLDYGIEINICGYFIEYITRKLGERFTDVTPDEVYGMKFFETLLSYDVVANVLNCNIIVSEFELQLHNEIPVLPSPALLPFFYKDVLGI